MKGIECCGDCVYYNWKKHRCTNGANKDPDPRSPFFADCPLKDVQPVVHGKWEPVRYTTHCSCGKSYETYHYLCTACNHVAYAQPYGLKYCPNCGAKMDKKVNDDD